MEPEATIEEAISELKREIAMRKAVYPKWIAGNRMVKSEADRRMRGISKALALIEQQGRLL